MGLPSTHQLWKGNSGFCPQILNDKSQKWCTVSLHVCSKTTYFCIENSHYGHQVEIIGIITVGGLKKNENEKWKRKGKERSFFLDFFSTSIFSPIFSLLFCYFLFSHNLFRSRYDYLPSSDSWALPMLQWIRLHPCWSTHTCRTFWNSNHMLLALFIRDPQRAQRNPSSKMKKSKMSVRMLCADTICLFQKTSLVGEWKSEIWGQKCIVGCELWI